MDDVPNTTTRMTLAGDISEMASVLGVDPDPRNCLIAATALVDAVVAFLDIRETPIDRATHDDDAGTFAYGIKVIEAENRLERLVAHRRANGG